MKMLRMKRDAPWLNSSRLEWDAPARDLEAELLYWRLWAEFNPEQPRDEHGRWTSEGGSSGDINVSVETSGQVESGYVDTIHERLDNLNPQIKSALEKNGVSYRLLGQAQLREEVERETGRYSGPGGGGRYLGDYDPNTGVVRVDISGPQTMSTFSHETMHAYNDAIGRPSESQEWKALADKVDSSSASKGASDYLTSAGNPLHYVNEQFAELAGQVISPSGPFGPSRLNIGGSPMPKGLEGKVTDYLGGLGISK
jgi:hypothetical protein